MILTIVCDPNTGKIYKSIEEAEEDFLSEDCSVSVDGALVHLAQEYRNLDVITAIVNHDEEFFEEIRNKFYSLVDEKNREIFNEWLRCDCIVGDIEI